MTTRILFASPEAVPFASTGGLGEVAGSLPAALNACGGADCRLIMPLYGQIGADFRKQMTFLGQTTVDVAWRRQYLGLWQMKIGGVTCYFIDNERYFKRENIYGYYDDCERYAYFCRAVFEALNLMDFQPDVIHANDWQCALIPIYQTLIYKRAFMKTVFTIHNVEYQGSYGTEVLEDCLGISKKDFHLVELGGGVNLMKGAIESANAVTTVSPTYARELHDADSAFGLDRIIRRNGAKLTGILNGIDKSVYDPKTDRYISSHFSANSLAGKKRCKRALQNKLGLPPSDAPLLTMVSRLVPAKGTDLITAVMEGMAAQNDMQLVMLGTGFPGYEAYFRDLQTKFPDKVVSMIEFDNAKAHEIYAAGDIFLMPSRSEPCGIAQMIACRYGNIPVVRETGGLRDSITDCTTGEGNGFTFAAFDPEDFRCAVTNALDLYPRKRQWNALVRHVLSLNFGWDSSAEKYIGMYDELMKGK